MSDVRLRVSETHGEWLRSNVDAVSRTWANADPSEISVDLSEISIETRNRVFELLGGEQIGWNHDCTASVEQSKPGECGYPWCAESWKSGEACVPDRRRR